MEGTTSSTTSAGTGFPAGISPGWRVRIGLAAAMLGGILILFQPSTTVGVIGVVFVAIGSLLAWPGPKFAGTWYLIVLVGALLAALSPVVALAAEALGGWMGAVGTLLILCGAIAGVPGMREAGEAS